MAPPRPHFRIGLVLGTEVGFPEVFEDLVALLDHALAEEPGAPSLEVERVRLGPYSVAEPIPYDLLVDRVSHWHPFAREWLKTAALDGCTVINHPFQFQTHGKQVGFAALARLGLDLPPTWALPPKDQSGLLPGAPERLHELFSLDEVGRSVGYPLYLKPHDGGGWIGVSRARGEEDLTRAYDDSRDRVMLAQGEVPSLRFARCMVVGPRVAALPYDPYAPLHLRYRVDPDFLSPEEEGQLTDLCRWVNAFHGFEWNTVEVLLEGGRCYPIDFFNGVPDCSPTSLHDYFLWTVASLLEWCLFGLVRGRRMRLSTRMQAWLDAARRHPGRAEREDAYRDLAAAYYQLPDFERFSRGLGARVREVAEDYARSPLFRQRIEETVRHVFPEEEHESFVAHFQERIRPILRSPGPWYGWSPSPALARGTHPAPEESGDIPMNREEVLEKAAAHFRALVESQLDRVEGMKQSEEPIDYQSLETIRIGHCGGDGIGPYITRPTADIMAHLLRKHVDSGKVEIVEIEGLTIENRVEHQAAIPEDVLAELKKCHLILKGPTETPQKGDPRGNISSANVAMRRELDLYANCRPVKVPEANIDWMFYRENTEGAYVLGSQGLQATEDLTFDFKVITRPGAHRICRAAFEYAKRNGRTRVTCVTKANVVKTTDGLFSEVFYQIAEEYPEIQADEWYIDIMTAKLIDESRRSQFQVMVMPNLYGDILTDEAAQIQGGVGTAGSANIGDRCAMFEAIHGSGNRMVDEGRAEYANPVSIMRAAALLLRHGGFIDEGTRLDMALDVADHEKKVQATGQKDGDTAAAFAEYLMELVDDENLADRL